MFQLQIFSHQLDKLTIINQPKFFNIQFEKKINDAGKLSFSLITNCSQATITNLQRFNRVKLYEDDQILFTGFIDLVQFGAEVHSITCLGMVGYFATVRIESGAELIAGGGGSCASDLIDLMNSYYDSKITVGTCDVTTGFSKTFKFDDFGSAIKAVADTTNGEYEVDDNYKFNFKKTIGEDKSNKITLRYDYFDVVSNNITNKFTYVNDNRNFANKIMASSKTKTVYSTDFDSVEAFGLHTYFLNAGDVDDATLNLLADNELLKRSNPVSIQSLELLPDKFSLSDLHLGDLVATYVITPYFFTDDVYKIVSINVKIETSGNKTITVELGDKTTNKASEDFLTYLQKLDNRVDNLEMQQWESNHI